MNRVRSASIGRRGLARVWVSNGGWWFTAHRELSLSVLNLHLYADAGSGALGRSPALGVDLTILGVTLGLALGAAA